MGLISGVRALHDGVFGAIDRAIPPIVPAIPPHLTALVVRAVLSFFLLMFFWKSALTKVVGPGDAGFLGYLMVDIDRALIQMAPYAYQEVASFDANALGIEYWAMAYAGTYAEFLLPALVAVGFFTRLASLGMVGFVLVMTYVDVTGHFTDIDYMRGLWIVGYLYLVLRGGGWLSVDRLMGPTTVWGAQGRD